MPSVRASLDADGLYARAVATLARRGRSETELRRLLQPRARSATALDQALARLRDHGYLDDARLADSAAAYQKEVERHGRARVLRDLRARGLSPGVAEAAVERSFRGENEDAQLRAYLRKKRLQRPEDLRRAAALYRRLLLAGFTPAACRRALRAWRVDAEWLDALDETVPPPEELNSSE